MINFSKLQAWRYYFFDLPLWASGIRFSGIERRLFDFFQSEIPSLREGIIALLNYLDRPVSEPEIEDIVRKTFLVKIVREGDAYACLRMNHKRFSKYFRTQGVEHLLSAREKKRPIVILTGHFGSFYSAEVAFSLLGLTVYPIVRAVDYSAVTPLSRSLYEEVNYRFTEWKSPCKFIYTDFSGKIDRAVFNVMNSGGIILACIDIPHRLYPHKHLPVKLFGQPATLPAGLLQWAVKKDALFFTFWNSVVVDSTNSYRHLSVEPIPESSNAGDVLQIYADRLSKRVSEEPWQWLALPVIKQYSAIEREKKND